MAYQRKTYDRWDIETRYGYGWVCGFTRQEALAQLRCYRDNVGNRCAVRLTKHREKIEEDVA